MELEPGGMRGFGRLKCCNRRNRQRFHQKKTVDIVVGGATNKDSQKFNPSDGKLWKGGNRLQDKDKNKQIVKAFDFRKAKKTYMQTKLGVD